MAKMHKLYKNSSSLTMAVQNHPKQHIPTAKFNINHDQPVLGLRKAKSCPKTPKTMGKMHKLKITTVGALKADQRTRNKISE